MRWLNRFRSDSRPRPARRWRRRLIILLLLCLPLAGLAGGAFWAARSGVLAASASFAGTRLAALGGRLGLAVANVTVEGRERVSREAILDALGAQRGTPILAVDLQQAKARLAAMPWVRDVAIERRLPDTIHIKLTERRPLAFWQRQGKLVLIDRDGKIVPTERLDGFGALPVLVGEDAPAQAASLIDMLVSEPELAPHVAAAVRVGDRRWTLHLDSGIDVALPEEDAEGAWHRLAALERKDALLERKIEVVDLRLPDRLVLRLPPEPAKPPPPKKGRPSGKTT